MISIKFQKILPFILISILYLHAENNRLAQTSHLHITFEHLTSKHGLSQSAVNTIIQDSRGFLWFGTQDGLNRYDGYTFKKYYHDSQDPNSISAKNINDICEQKNAKVLWIATEGGGINRFDLETQEFSHYKHNPNDSSSLSSNFITCLEYTSSDFLWIATNNNGLNRLNIKTGKIKQYHYHPDTTKGISSETVTAIIEDSKGRLWLGLNTPVLEKFNPENEEFIHITLEERFNSEFILDICEINNKLWLGTNKSILIFDPENGKIESFTENIKGLPSDFRVEKLCLGPAKHLWAAVEDKGIYRFNVEEASFQNFSFNASDPNGISNNSIEDLYKDRTGNIWIGTTGSGINVVKNRNKNFFVYQHSPTDPHSLSHNNVWQIIEDPDFPGQIYWIATQHKLNKFNIEKKTFTHFCYAAEDKNSISSNNIISLYKDNKGNLWIGTNYKGLCVLNTRTNQIRKFNYDPHTYEGISSPQIFCITEGDSGKIWCGTSSAGLDCYDPHTDSFTNFSSDENDTTTLSNNLIWSLLQDEDGILWVGTNNKINRFNSKTKTFHRINNPEIRGAVYALIPDQNKKDILWLCTEFGLIKFNKKTGACYKYKNALRQETIYGAVFDNNGDLWLTTNRGLFQLHPETEEVKHYSASDGLPSDEFNFAAFCKNSRTNELIFGGLNGLVVFDPGDILKNTSPPPVVFTDLQIFNKSVDIDNIHLKKSITEAKKITLLPKDKVITFSFAALDFIAPENNLYAFKMENLDNNWNYIDNHRFTTYTNIPPGNYTFKVKAANSDGIWNEEGASIKIKVLPPFWKTTIFRIIMIIIAAGLLYSVYKIRIHYIENQKNKLEEKVKERTKKLNQEIIERKAAERELEEREKYLTSILRDTPDAIVVTDSDLKVVSWNPGAEKTFKYSKEETIGKNLNDLVVGKDKMQEGENLGKKVFAGKLVHPFETVREDKYGNPIHVILAASPIFVEKKMTGMVIVYTDITSQKKHEEELEKSLKEKNILLKEIHHRVKNNLSVISSLLNLQSSYLDNEKAKEMFEDSRNRVLTMMKIHEKLYQSDDITKVDFESYLEDTVNNLFKIYGINWDNISYNVDVKNVSLSIEKAIPCGLIINELVTNSLKYAFNDMKKEKGIIEILINKSNKEHIELIIRDNGKGIPKDINLEKTDSLGLKLVDILSRGQLEGTLSLNVKDGTEFKIKFPDKK
ncbi:MAG: two-component regulator propeller domain-containing protein [bacterium]